MNPLLDPNYQRGNILPIVKDTRTGERSLGAPQFVVDLLSALMLPGDVYKGNVLLRDPETGNISDEVIKRSADLAGAMTLGGSGATGVSRQMAGQSLVDPTQLNVIPVDLAKRTNVRNSLPTDDLFRAAIDQTPGAQITDEGLLMRLARRQKPEQSGEMSVRTGVFYLPEGDPNLKHYKGKGANFLYGGADDIKGETLYKNPLFVKGATGGKAPEAAFDAIKGKGAYQKMRDDALQSIPPYYVKDRATRVEMLQKFLEKYAPELEGYEEYILQSSGKGNQLPYALQEAAVAHAVRQSGNDAVIGYSTRRGTKAPFVSEVFDVREDYYPSPDGGFSLHPLFEPKR